MNFFGVLPVRRKEMKTKFIRLPRRDRQELAEEVLGEKEYFLNREPKPFDPGYKLEDDEIFEVKDFALPEHLTWAANNSEACGDIERAEVKPQSVKAIVGVSLEPLGMEASSDVGVAAFKALDRSKVLDASRRRFEWSPDTFVRRTQPSVVVPEGLDAVYENGSLFFRTFRTANGFLDLTGIFQELTNEAVVGVLHDVTWLTYQNSEVPFEKALNQTCRKLFSLMKATEGFSELELDLIKGKALEIGFPLRTNGEGDNEAILLPSNPGEMKMHLEFLLQRVYPGIFDGKLRRSNSSEVL